MSGTRKQERRAVAGRAWQRGEIVAKNVKRETTLMTDEGRHYVTNGKTFAEHQTVEHQRDEYVRDATYTNTIEGYFSVFKRGMKGIYQHCDERHLHRYLAEFDFRYSNRAKLGVFDRERADKAEADTVG